MRVGNIMLDSFEMMRGQIEADGTRASMGLEPGQYAVVTLHRPSNVDTREALEPLVQQLVAVSKDLQLVFAVHPRTKKKLEEFGLLDSLSRQAGEGGGEGALTRPSADLSQQAGRGAITRSSPRARRAKYTSAFPFWLHRFALQPNPPKNRVPVTVHKGLSAMMGVSPGSQSPGKTITNSRVCT